MATLSIAAGAVLAILLGLAVGAFIAWHRTRFAPATEPFVSLLRALRPLLLPLFAIGIVGSAQFPLWGTVAVSALLYLIALLLVVVPEGRALTAAEHWDMQVLREVVRELRKPAAWLIALMFGLAVVASVLLSTRYFKSIGGAPAFLLVFALWLWLAAFLLRVVSYASTGLRVAIATFVALSGYCLGAAIGVVPGGPWLSDNASWLYVALPATALALLVAEGARVVLAGGAQSEAEWTQVWRGLGLIVSLLATLFLAISAVVGLWETAQPGERLSTESAIEAAESSPAAPGRFQDDLALARAYTPVLAFTRDERWTPISVDSYAREAVLSGPLKEPPADPGSATEKLDRACPRLAGSPCYRLSIRCKDGHEACGMGDPHPDRNSERLYSEGDVYVRVAKRSAEEAEERRRETEHLRPSDRWPPKVFVDEGPYRESLTTLLQYWYFYRYDEWEARVFAGQLVQRHEGDWEAVTIGLSDRKPLFVAYSAHCGGTWKPWKATELSDKFPEPTHPLVAVAEGSHANYPKADQKRTPDPAHCQGIPAGTTALLSYASNIRDKTEYGWQWYPAAGGWHLVDDDTLPMSFPGYWGANDSTTLVGFFKSTQLSEGHAPRTPSQQPLWESPVAKIFCGNYSGPSGDYHCKGG